MRKNMLMKLFLALIFFSHFNLLAQPSSRAELHTFYSPALGISKNYNIYLPAGYDSSTERYPVVYFLRGHEREWFNPTEDGTRNGETLQTIADSLIASGQIGKMILVGPSTASTDNTVPCLGVNLLRPDLSSASGIGTGKFEDYFVTDLIHNVDSTYRTIADRYHRGIDGFSLGGYTSVMMGVKHPEIFSSVGCYDGTHMWYDFDDTRVNNPPPDDYTWISNSIFNPAFDSVKNVPYMKTYNASNIVRGADSSALAQIHTVKFFIHSAAFDGNQGNLDRGNHIKNTLLEKGILNGYSDIRLTATAIHNWYHADLHAKSSLVKHWQTFQSITGVKDKGMNVLPEKFELYQNYPNPFNPKTGVRFQVTGSRFVSLKIYDVLGEEIALLVNNTVESGTHTIDFDGSRFPSGVYYYTMSANGERKTRSMVLAK
jgi:predicted alpha/beta superfamily hydrolase